MGKNKNKNTQNPHNKLSQNQAMTLWGPRAKTIKAWTTMWGKNARSGKVKNSCKKKQEKQYYKMEGEKHQRAKKKHNQQSQRQLIIYAKLNVNQNKVPWTKKMHNSRNSTAKKTAWTKKNNKTATTI